MDIRVMAPSERSAVFEVWCAARTARTGPPSQRRAERVREKLQETGTTVYVAEDEDGIVGMVAAEPGRADDGQGVVVPGLMHISMVFVTPASQRQGVAGHLLRSVLSAAAQAGVDRVALWTDIGNTPAQRLYESLGMRQTEERQITDTMRWVRYEATPGETLSPRHPDADT